MEEEVKGENQDGRDKEEIYANAVRAGKRTYFFDVRETRGNDHYLTITESKKIFDDAGNFRYEKHKLFLYKEDFEKFGTALTEAFEVVSKLQKGEDPDSKEGEDKNYTDVDFEKLGTSSS